MTYLQACSFSAISKYFRDMIEEYADKRGSGDWDMSLYDVPLASESFWNGFRYHIPFFDVDLPSKRALALHLLKSLKYHYKDKRRTDQILLYLAKSRAFEENEFLHEWSAEFPVHFADFARDNINGPLILAFFDLKDLKHLPPWMFPPFLLGLQFFTEIP